MIIELARTGGNRRFALIENGRVVRVWQEAA